MRVRQILAAGLFLGLYATSFVTAAADFPSRPITLVVAFPAGGGVDTVGRLIGDEMAKTLGQPVIVNNRPGAAGQVGTDYVATRAEADGYTILLGSPGAITAGPALFPDLNYKPAKDLAAVGLAVRIPNLVAANPDFPANNVSELVALAKSGKHKITYGSGGIGTSQHLAGELLAYTLGIDMLHVPYKGTAPSITDAIGGQIDMTFADPTVAPYIRSGKLKLIGITLGERSKALPDFPTLAEQGAKGYDAGNWYGFLAPKKTPAAVIERLNDAVNHALEKDSVQKQLLSMGMDPSPMTPDEFQKFLDKDTAQWSELVKKAGIKAR